MKNNLLILLVLFLAACAGEDKPKGFDYGKVENDKYVNTYFGFEIDVPENWAVQDQEQVDALNDMGSELVAGDDEGMKAVLEASKVNVANLLVAYEHELGAMVDFNPSIIIVAENIKNYPGIKTGKEYLFNAKKLLLQSQLQYDYIDDDFKKETIDGVDFYIMNSEANYAGLSINQTYYSTVMNGFSLSFIYTFNNDEQEKQLSETLHSLDFDS